VTAAPIVPVTAVAMTDPLTAVQNAQAAQAAMPVAPRAVASTTFADMLTTGLDNVTAKVANADRLVRAFVLDDSVPVHQVTYAMEQARMSLQMVTQVRQHLLDGYQQIMNMQI
jgi:flagellar hook-basal body complex protein FliE